VGVREDHEMVRSRGVVRWSGGVQEREWGMRTSGRGGEQEQEQELALELALELEDIGWRYWGRTMRSY
jgi:hypothetical protein